MRCYILKTVELKELANFTKSSLITDPRDCDFKDIFVSSDFIYRFGLELIGSKSSLGVGCVLVMGASERRFLNTLLPEEKIEILEPLFARRFSALFLADDIGPDEFILKFSKKYRVPVFLSRDNSTVFSALIANFLEEKLEPTITRPAGFLSIHGEGILLIGESGIGKSEVALELVHRGHKFISDDLTEIQKSSLNSLVGFSPSNISKLIEVRGLGIIDVQQLFGVNAIKKSETIDMVINFEPWNKDKIYERFGTVEKYANILGVEIPYTSIPIKPGKNLAVIVEVAAMNNRLKKQGINSHNEFMAKISKNKSDFSTQNIEKELAFTW